MTQQTNNDPQGRRSRLEAALRAVEDAGNTLMAANIRKALRELTDADKE